MKFFIGALSLAVILALVGTPAVLLFGWGYLTASDRQADRPNHQDERRGRL